ncbi:MAG: alpha/beta hydrolase [Saprospiraceae bacterium]|nr:alpha/beta hydrolase [Saprospiraceae bacterium]
MRLITLVLLIFITQIFYGQNQYLNYDPTGYWTGAVIRNGNAVQIVEAEITRQGSDLRISISTPDRVFFPSRASNVRIERNTWRFETPYGLAEMLFDSTYMELVGTAGQEPSLLNFHLKKSLRPVKPKISERELSFNNNGFEFGGTLFLPELYERPLACAILVHGRSCGGRNSFAGQARKLAEYGIATIAFDKRGSNVTGFDCNKITAEMLVGDVLAVIKKAAEQPEIDAKRIGMISNSAGGWIVPRAARESKVEIAFLVTMVGPSTSVKEQQLDCIQAYGTNQGFTAQMIKDAKHYTELMFATNNLDQVFVEMQELLKKARAERWDVVLESTDIPASAADIKNLWVQRFDCDPAADLKAFKGSFLSILGGADDIVPYQSQIKRFEEIFRESGKENYSIAVMPSAGHDLGHRGLMRDLGQHPTLKTNLQYLKYPRVAADAAIEIINFLRQYDFIPE